MAGIGVGVLQPSTYAFLVRPGLEQVARTGGLHAFFNWSGPVLTDSGGIVPAESWGRPGTPAARVVKVDDDGLVVSSYLDGSPIRITPESSIAAQMVLGGDALTALTPPASARRDPWRVRRWAERALAARSDPQTPIFLEPTDAADVELLGELDFAGVVSDELAIIEAADTVARVGPSRSSAPARRDDEKPTQQKLVHVWTGHAGPQDAVKAVRAGADVISGSAAVQLAGLGRAWTSEGELDLRDLSMERQYGPLEPDCACPTCAVGFARGYVHHLFRADELLGPTLLTLHNVHVLTTAVAAACTRPAD